MTRHPTPQPPAAPTSDTLDHTAPQIRYPRTHRTRIETSSTATPRPSNSLPPRWATQRTPSSYDATEDSVPTPLYYSALRPDNLPAHLLKPRFQLALEQLPLLTRYHRWYAHRSIHVPAGKTKCICGHAGEETWDHFKRCPLYRGLDTLKDRNPTHTIAQHAGWPTRSPATQQLATILKQTEVLEAVRRGLVPTAVYTLPGTHAEDPQATAADGRCQDRGAARTNTCSMQPPRAKQTKPTSSNFCSTNRESLPHNIPPSTGCPPCRHTIHQAEHQHGTHEHHTHHTHTRQHARATSPRPSTGTANRQPPHAPSACASGYHRRPYPAPQTTGSA